MRKNCIYLVIILLLVSLPALADELLANEFVKYETYGEVLAAHTADGKAYIRSNGFYGYHLDEDPYMTVDVAIDQDGLVESVSYVDSKAQTPGFPDMLTKEHYNTYVGTDASTVLEVDVVSGATVTSQAVRYAVQTALYYAQNAYGIFADTTAGEIAQLQAVYPGNYSVISTDYEVDSTIYGTVLFAAEDESSVAIKVQSSKKLNYRKSSDTGWPNAEPDQYVMVIVVDKASQEIVATQVIVDGTKRTEYFVVPDEKLNAYMQIPIAEETVFDEFTDGLVFEIDAALSKDAMGLQIITGTSIIFTGASIDGTFSSQLVRRCFQTAARFFCNYQ